MCCLILYILRLNCTNYMVASYPETASRKHIEKINPVITAALDEANVTLEDIDAIAVTYGPGWLVRCS